MTCEAYRALLARWLDGEATETELEQMAAHEAACPDCAAERAAAEALRDDLREALDDVPPMPAGLHGQWMRAVDAEARTRNERAAEARARLRRRKRLIRWGSMAAAVLFVVGGAYLTWDRMDDSPMRRANARKVYVPTTGVSAPQTPGSGEPAAPETPEPAAPQNSLLTAMAPDAPEPAEISEAVTADAGETVLTAENTAADVPETAPALMITEEAEENPEPWWNGFTHPDMTADEAAISADGETAEDAEADWADAGDESAEAYESEAECAEMPAEDAFAAYEAAPALSLTAVPTACPTALPTPAPTWAAPNGGTQAKAAGAAPAEPESPVPSDGAEQPQEPAETNEAEEAPAGPENATAADTALPAETPGPEATPSDTGEDKKPDRSLGAFVRQIGRFLWVCLPWIGGAALIAGVGIWMARRRKKP